MPDTELLEYVCNENEQDFQHFVTTDDDRKRFVANVKVSPGVLAKYVGFYESEIPGGKLSYEVSLSGDRLMILPPGGGGRLQFMAESKTTFYRAIAGDSVEFVSDAKGA